jgi:hypothetical protein
MPHAASECALTLALLSLTACTPRTIQDDPWTISVASPEAASRLLYGFHPIEQGRWRWTKQRFSIAIFVQPKPEAANRNLIMRFVIPDEIANKLLPVEIFASLDGAELRPEAYRMPGRQKYQRAVPAKYLTAPEAVVSFRLSRSLLIDDRELGIIVETVGLE